MGDVLSILAARRLLEGELGDDDLRFLRTIEESTSHQART